MLNPLGKYATLYFRCKACGSCFFVPHFERKLSMKWPRYSFQLLLVCEECGQIHKWDVVPFENKAVKA